MNSLQRMAGISAISEAIIYILTFVFWGVFWAYPMDGNAVEKMSYLAQNEAILLVADLIMYILWAVLLSVLVIAIHERLKDKSPAITQIATLFGAIWVGLIIASGMISHIGLAAVVDLSVLEPEKAMAVHSVIVLIVNGLGGGNEVVGGLWVLLLSIAALKANDLSKKLNYLGLFVGSAGILTMLPVEGLTETFGISQIFWFLWLGLILLKNKKPAF
ncbi:MAG: hypothetical protein K9G26_05870 [Emcibacter sp.]|nr:hypothetical protein [Emcibacter sp.]